MEIKLEIGQNHPRKLTDSSAKLHASLTKMLSVSVSHKVETSLIYREKEKVCLNIVSEWFNAVAVFSVFKCCSEAAGCSHGVLPGPLPGALVVLGHVGLVEPGDLRHERIVWVGITQ